MSIAETDQLFTRREAAKYLGLRPQTLAKWAMDGSNVPFIRVGRSVRYRRSDLEEFLRRRTVGSLPPKE